LIAASFLVRDGVEVGPAMVEPPAALTAGVTLAVCTYRRPAALDRLWESVRAQTRVPDAIVIVDASPDSATEEVVRRQVLCEPSAREVRYYRVTGVLRGLTKQRNLALTVTGTDLIAFFDDDIVLRPEALGVMERAHREQGPGVVGVGAYIENQHTSPGLLWSFRRLLYIVPALTPGKYYRSGMSTPWSFLAPTTSLIEGDWLPGGATMWRTHEARETRFNESFAGYASGEDLEFSLRVGRRGRLLLAGDARVLHLHAGSGRPDHYLLGRSAVQHQSAIHRHCIADRRRRDACWFMYAQCADLVLRSAGLVRARTARANWHFLRGRLHSLVELAWGKRSLS
jgi:GT2 family glycosyltransferase